MYLDGWNGVWNNNNTVVYSVVLPLVCGSNVLIHPVVGEGSHYSVMKNIAEEGGLDQWCNDK